jgi:hypothetical protein
MSNLCSSVFICGWLWFVAGCASAVSHGQNPALSGVDLVRMTDDMAMRIASDRDVVAAAGARGGKLTVVVQPAENYMRAEVLPPGQAEAFTGRVRTLLARHAPDRFTWVMNRDAFYRLRSRELEGVEPGPSPEAVNPTHALTAKFSSLGDENSRARTNYYLCVYELTDLSDRTVVWAGSYEVKKTAVKGFLD